MERLGVTLRNPAGYALITEPPKPEEYKVQYGVRLDTSRLIVQWLVLLAATAGTVLLAGVERNRDKKGMK